MLFPVPAGLEDYGVAGDGALVLTRSAAGNIHITCYNADRSVRRAEFVAGLYDLQPNDAPPHPTVYMARDSQKVLVTWYDRNGGDAGHRLAYTMLDATCQPIVENETAIAVPGGYFEFHDGAIDALGNAVVAVSPNDSFRRRHQEIPLRGDNFVLGEVYNWITPQADRITHHFEYTPAGELVAEDSTDHNLEEGLTIRVDQNGFSYLRDAAGLHILAAYP